jgi:hypothetical protein
VSIDANDSAPIVMTVRSVKSSRFRGNGA